MSGRRLRAMALCAGAVWALTLAAIPSAAFEPPTPVVRTLPNGLTVALFQDDRLPIVQIQLLVPAGAAHEPVGQAGMANLTAHLLGRGTASRTAPAFAAAVEALGASVGATASLEFTTVTGSFLAADLEAGLELIVDAVVHSRFGEEELPAVKYQIAAALARARQQPGTLAEEHLWAAVYAGHPYGHSPQGALGTLNVLGAAQVRAFHREWFRPNRAVLAIAGDVEPERVFRVVEEQFGPWGGRAPEWRPPSPPPLTGWRVRIVDTPGLGRAELRFGAQGPARGARDYEAMVLVSELLGAGPEAGMRGSVVGLRDGGLVSVAASAPVDSVGARVARVRAALARSTAELATDDALAAARRRHLGSFTLRFDTFGGRIAPWLAGALHGLPGDAVTGYAGRVGALTAPDIRTAAAHWLGSDRMVLVAVGPADRLRPQLESLGQVEVVPAEAAAEVLEAPSASLAPPSPEALAKGRALVGQALVAHGGLARLRGIQDSRLEGDVLMTEGEQQLAGQITQLRREPMQFAFSSTFAGVRSIQVLDGDRAWATIDESPPRYDDLDSLARASLRAGFRSDLQHLLIAAADSSSRVAWRGQQRVGDLNSEVIEVVARDGDRRILFLDATSHRLVAMEQNEAGHSARRLYRDFRDVNGVQWPFGEDRMLDGQRVMTLTLRRVAFNAGLTDQMFRKPGATPEPGKRPRPR